MAFEPGNELQRLGHKQRILTEHLRRAAMEGDGKRIRQGCDKLMDAFSEGQPWALALVMDRLEGKAAQAVTVSGDEDRPLVSMIKMVVVSANSNQINSLAAIEGEKKVEIEDNSLAYPPLPLPPKVNFSDGGGV